MGTPIRLVRNDGGIIELMATTLTMNVDRGVTPFTMPFAGGSRFAFDLNLPKALITVEGVMTDDDLQYVSNNVEATAIVDFSAVSGRTSIYSAIRWTTDAIDDVIANIPTADNAGVASADHAITISSSHKVYFTKHSSSNEGLTGGRYFIAVHDGTSARSAADIATSLTTLITTYSGTFGMTATTINSPILNTTNSAVQLTQVNLGSSGNVSHPSFDTWGSQTYKPYHTQFSGGKTLGGSNGRSAGDKVAELFAVLNNSNNGGGGAATSTALLTGGGAIAGGLLTGGAGAVGGAALGAGAAALLLNDKYGDYIIAIQIPFTSRVNDAESLFYMPTGAFMKTVDKTADNAEPAGSEYTGTGDEYTAIKGTVANATFVQLGGEPIYSYTINFAPIDWIF
jgi:hypothetical protein